MGKLRAFLVHLAVSAAVTAGLVALAVWLWFPLPYFTADGGWQGIRLVAAIDVVLGPCLTLVAYSRKKSRRALTFDYLVIGLLQIGALSFGVWTVFAERTVMVILADGAFYSVDAETAVGLGDRGAAVMRHSKTRPAYAFIAMPEDQEARQALRKESLSTGRPLYLFSELLESLDVPGTTTLEEYALDPKAMVDGSLVYRRRLGEFLDTRSGQAQDFMFFPVVSRYENFVLAFDKDSTVPDGWLEVEVRPPYKRQKVL